MTRRVVVWPNSARMLRWMRASVAMSTAEVASSRMRILGRETMARARQRSWRWPWERLSPPSLMREVREVKMLVLGLGFVVVVGGVSGSLPGLGLVVSSGGVMSLLGTKCTRSRAS